MSNSNSSVTYHSFSSHSCWVSRVMKLTQVNAFTCLCDFCKCLFCSLGISNRSYLVCHFLSHHHLRGPARKCRCESLTVPESGLGIWVIADSSVRYLNFTSHSCWVSCVVKLTLWTWAGAGVHCYCCTGTYCIILCCIISCLSGGNW